MELQRFAYDNRLSRMFLNATMFWGFVGMLVGLTIALELVFPLMSSGIPWLSFGRLRPLHTNAVVFAFVGNGMFTGIYYSTPRLLKTPMYSQTLGKIHFWGWQLIIAAAVFTLPLGFTVGKEYAELEWPIDIAIAIVWIIFGINLIMTMVKRRVKHIYVAIWFYIATFVTVAVLHIVNSINIPVSLFKSYPVYAGIQDALVQWWYGHNAVAFFLTTPYLGLMYYFVPKAANRPIYSYKLSIIHFWALIFLYIWAGPHHLLYSALPDWAQALGVAFSIMLIGPSWGGMLNGLLTLRGAWDKVRESPVLKMFVVGITAYGMATFEGPLLSLKSVNAISHFTDWTIAHVHIGALGWNGMITFGMLYWLLPRLFNTKLYSKKLANTHFWLATSGMLFFAIPLYFAAFTQSLMWKEFTEAGYLRYPNFIETVVQILPMYYLRALGGALYLTGVILLIYNLVMTARSGSFVRFEEDEAPALRTGKISGEKGHRIIESKPVLFTILALIAISIGGLVEFVPMFMVKSNVPTIAAVQPYTPLELHGRDIYVREGCYLCHSQMVRPFRSEVERYGDYSKAGEVVYDHPFQFGSKRTGPDLARAGVQSGPMYKPASWHYNHFLSPQKMVAQSIMPPYPWLIRNDLDISTTTRKIKAMQYLGVPYPEGFADKANAHLQKQAYEIAQNLRDNGIQIEDTKEVIALIAYIHRLGRDIHGGEKVHFSER
ncbi:MAG: cytochrome-c oxidase, cbb3-type subunit I [Bacteroidales bacterium]|jgi:cytochrome c oxidase cbb3-type subunit I/II|nr:cytochrome-c oxidase, cbb3-type subunit I [Bacteroidales bacterium]MDY0369875.1 cytochrome-c oxidase, cbb3-type subunit I [Bacteroidales bacterium]